ncbi:heme-binding protein [soil metagenome]
MTIRLPRGRLAFLSIGATALVGAAVLVAQPFQAAAADDCTASGLARTVSDVTSSVADYLDAHPEVNTAFTNMKGLPRQQMRASAEQYLAANPAVRSDLQGIRAPLTDFSQRCGMAVPAGLLGP